MKNNKWINSIFEGDCLELLKSLPANCIDMVLCDLPYGVTQNGWDEIINLSALWTQYRRVTKENAAVILSSQGLFTGRLMMSNPTDFRFKIVWIKSRATNFLNVAKQPLRKHEDICVFYRNQPTYHPQMSPGKAYNKGFRKDNPAGTYGEFAGAPIRSEGGRYPTDILFYEDVDDFVYTRTCEHESGGYWHPTQKPIELARYLIRTFSNPGDIVLDNACGSGSFLVAAAMEARRYVGMELNQDVMMRGKPVNLIDICHKRLAEVKSTLF